MKFRFLIIFMLIFLSVNIYSQENEDSQNNSTGEDSPSVQGVIEEKPVELVPLSERLFVGENISDKDLSVIIFDFEDVSVSKGKQYLSKILSKNIKIEIDKINSYSSYSSNVSIKPVNLNEDGYSDYIELLSKIADRNKVKYIVTGQYQFEDSGLIIITHVYIHRLKKIVKLRSTRENIGIMINDLIDEMAVKIGHEFRRYIELKSDKPLIEPNSGVYKYFVDVEMNSELKDVSIWYTTDNTEPDKNSGEEYKGGTIPVYEDTVFKVRTLKENWTPSEIIERNYNVLYQPDFFSFTFSYSYMQFYGDWEKLIDKTFPQMYSLETFLDLGAIKSIKRNPVLRDFGLIAQFDAAHFTTNSEIEVHYNTWGGTAGLLYILRLGRYFSIDLKMSAGAVKTVLTSDSNYDGYVNFVKKTEYVSTSLDPCFKGGVSLRAVIKPLVFTAGYEYNRIEYKENPLNFAAYKAGVGFSF